MTALMRHSPFKRAPLRKRLLRAASLAQARRFGREEKGVAAVEFAFVAGPFLALTFAIMETSLVFFAGQTLETAASAGARLIMTDQASGFDKARFKTEVCKQVTALFDCDTGLLIDVKTAASFASVDTSKPVSNGSLNVTENFEKGQRGEIVVVRMMYKWPIALSSLGLTEVGKDRVLMSTVVFRNEP